MNNESGILLSVDALSLAVENLTSPPVLAFVLGALAVVVRSDLRLPDPIHTWLSAYLLLAIGLKGGSALRDVDPSDLIGRAVATLVIGLVTPSPVGVAMLNDRKPSPPSPSPAMHGPFLTNRVVFITRAIFVIVCTSREWMMAVWPKPCSYFFASAIA